MAERRGVASSVNERIPMVSFGTVCAWAFAISLVKVVGYGACAEKIYAWCQRIFGRAAYQAYVHDWKELKKAKQELGQVSAQVPGSPWGRMLTAR